MTDAASDNREHHPSPREAGAAFMIIGASLGFASISIFTTLATRAGIPLSLLLAGRYVVASLLLLPAISELRAARQNGADLRPLLIVGGIGQATIAALSLSALAYIPAATLVFLFYTFPAWVTVLAALRGSEPVDARATAALGLALLGIAALVGLPGSAAVHPLGAGLALGAALVYALYIPIVAKLQQGTGARGASLLICVAVAAIFLVATAVRGEYNLSYPPIVWWSVVGLGVLGTTIAFQLFLHGLAVLGPVRTSIISTAELFFAAILAATFLKQPITLPMIVGGLCICAAVVLLQSRRSERRR